MESVLSRALPLGTPDWNVQLPASSLLSLLPNPWWFCPPFSTVLTSVLGPSHLQGGSLSYFVTEIRKRPLFLSAFPHSGKGLVFISFQPLDKVYSCTADSKIIELLKSSQGPHTPWSQVGSSLFMGPSHTCHHAVHVINSSLPHRKSLYNIPPTRTRTPPHHSLCPFLPSGFPGSMSQQQESS